MAVVDPEAVFLEYCGAGTVELEWAAESEGVVPLATLCAGWEVGEVGSAARTSRATHAMVSKVTVAAHQTIDLLFMMKGVSTT
jgi:hypothetical protein